LVGVWQDAFNPCRILITRHHARAIQDPGPREGRVTSVIVRSDITYYCLSV